MSTQRRRHIIQCSPHISSEFVTGSGDLRLYEITTKHGIPNPNNLSFTTESVDEFRTKQNRSLRDDAKSFRLLSVNADIQNVRCVTWNPDVVQPRLVAAGLGSGRIALTNFSYSGFGISKEFIPRHGRLCNALDWNTTHKNHLASAHDKVRLYSSGARVTNYCYIHSKFQRHLFFFSVVLNPLACGTIGAVGSFLFDLGCGNTRTREDYNGRRRGSCSAGIQLSAYEYIFLCGAP